MRMRICVTIIGCFLNCRLSAGAIATSGSGSDRRTPNAYSGGIASAPSRAPDAHWPVVDSTGYAECLLGHSKRLLELNSLSDATHTIYYTVLHSYTVIVLNYGMYFNYRTPSPTATRSMYEQFGSFNFLISLFCKQIEQKALLVLLL